MARPYADPVEILTAPIPAQSPFIPKDAKIVVGAVAPASPDPIPIVLLPGFEYRLREWRHPRPTRVTGCWSGGGRRGTIRSRRVRALVYDAPLGPVTVRDLEDPSAPDGGVVVEVRATGLCRSDWHAWAGRRGRPAPARARP